MMKICFNDVVNFIRKAMSKKLRVVLYDTCITISKSNEKLIDPRNVIDIYFRVTNKTVEISIGPTDNYLIVTNNIRDVANWNILIEDVKEYTQSLIENNFFNFIEDESLKDIDSLDDEEED